MPTLTPRVGYQTTAHCIAEAGPELISNTAVTHKGDLFIFGLIVRAKQAENAVSTPSGWKTALCVCPVNKASFTDGFAPGTSAIHGGRIRRPGLAKSAILAHFSVPRRAAKPLFLLT